MDDHTAIRAYSAMGGDVVGMTLVPEVVLARELGMCYVGIAVATNYAAGISKKVSHEEVLAAMEKAGTCWPITSSAAFASANGAKMRLRQIPRPTLN